MIGITGVLALLLTSAGGAYGKTVSYTGEATGLKPGQTKGLPVLMGFDLRGRGCPAGPHCFDHAEVKNFDAVSWAYPNCPEILDSAFEFARGQRVAKAAPHNFGASGRSDSYAGTQITIKGRFLRHGRTAKGWFMASEAGCSTGHINWTATPD